MLRLPYLSLLGTLIVSAGCGTSVFRFPCESPADCEAGQACLDGSCTGGDGELITVTLGEGLGASVTGVTEDTFIELADPQKNWGGQSLLHTDDNTSQTRVVLLRFDLASLPTTASVAEATLGLTTWQNNPSLDVHFVYEILEAWQEGEENDAVGIANWTARTPTADWSVAGCGPPSSRSNTVLAQFIPDATVDPQRFELPISTTLVQRWIAQPSSNHGMAIAVGGDDGGSLHSSEGDSDSRPTLEISYR